MPAWSEILAEYQESARQRPNQGPDGDAIRLKYLKRLQAASGRAVIFYGSAWLTYSQAANALSVEGNDVHAMMEVCHGVDDKKVDLVLHTPGGAPAAAEQIMEYLRTRFDNIRAIVPLQAKSAGTMMALGADEIVMGDHSELGPIDPQILIPTPEGIRFVAAHALLRDFAQAKRECADNVNVVAAWTPILRSYVGLLDFCQQQIDLSMDVVAGWLERYMLRDPAFKLDAEQRPKRAREIAEFFGSHDSYQRFKSHSRPIRAGQLKALGLKVTKLEDNKALREAVLSVYHAAELSLREPVAKIVENHLGKRHVRIQGTVQLVQTRPAPKSPEAKPAA